jgi:hypothetical protein
MNTCASSHVFFLLAQILFLARCFALPRRDDLTAVLMTLTVRLGSGPVVVAIVHGGYWKNKYNMDNAMADTIAPFLAGEGFISVEIE